nr:MAG TPA: hypothetical protein [Caudoviricetes sp.]
MQKLAKKCISKNIIKILKIYQKDFEKSMFEEKSNYLDDKIFFEIDFLIKLIKERND